MNKVKYDTPIEVNKLQYMLLVKFFTGIIAHRTDNGRYWIKIFDMRFSKDLQKALKQLNAI